MAGSGMFEGMDVYRGGQGWPGAVCLKGWTYTAEARDGRERYV